MKHFKMVQIRSFGEEAPYICLQQINYKKGSRTTNFGDLRQKEQTDSSSINSSAIILYYLLY